MVNRREWFVLMTAAGAAAATTAKTFAAQLYTVRSLLRKEPDRVLKTLGEIGFKEVEGYNRLQLVTLAPKLRQFGLRPLACTVETPLITANWDPFPDLKQISLQEALDSLAGIGAEYFVMGYIPPGARGDGEDFYRRTADRMNAAAELCRKSGLKFVWQNHAFEFAGRLGSRPIDLYKERLDPKLVGIELDVFWVSMAGLDPLKMLREWKGRVQVLRLNDCAKGTPLQFTEDAPRGAYTEAGNGLIDFPSVLRAARAAGVKAYTIGQDEVEGDPLESLSRSFNYTKDL